MSDKNPLKIRQVHHIEMYVGNAKQADYYYRNAFGFDRVAYTGLETGNREQCSYALQQGTFRLLLTTPYTPRDPSGVHILKHGDGVRDIAFEVDDADFAFERRFEEIADLARQAGDHSDSQAVIPGQVDPESEADAHQSCAGQPADCQRVAHRPFARRERVARQEHRHFATGASVHRAAENSSPRRSIVTFCSL